jgi:hypothetical protein
LWQDAPVDRPVGLARQLGDPYPFVAGLLVALSAALAARRPWSGDLGIHAATIERLRVSFTDPGNPLVDAGGPSPYYSPYTLALAGLARLTHLSAVTVLMIVGPLVLVMLLWAMRAFVRTRTDRPLAPTLAVVFVLLLWGVEARVWSGFFSLWALPFVLAFPSTFALALTLWLWTGLARTLDGPVRWRRYLGLGALAGLVALVHPFTVVLAGLGALALVIHRGRGLPKLAWAALGVAGAEAAALVALWPYYSFLDLLRAGAQLDEIHRPLYDRPWLYYGLIVLALPALWRRWRRDRSDPLVLLFLGGLLAVGLGGLTGRYALGRVWPAVMLSGQLALAVELAAPLPRRLARIWLPATVVACLVGLGVQGANLLYLAPRSMLPPAVRQAAGMYVDWPDYSWLGRYVKPGEVVLTDDYFAVRTVPAYGARTVTPAWPDPFLADEAQRRRDLAVMINPRTDPATRAALLSRYRVRWVLEIPGRWSIDDGRTPVATGPRGQRLYQVSGFTATKIEVPGKSLPRSGLH